MNTKKIIIAFLALVVLIAGFLYFSKKSKKYTPQINLSPTPSIEEQIEKKFGRLTIPDDANKIELKNMSGGEGIGIATDTGVYADLPEIKLGEYYQVFVSKGNSKVLVGKLIESKGGWILEFDMAKYKGYDTISVIRDGEMILQGSF